jgi:hypothetical protein
MGGNVGESQASRLGSHFSLMMLVHVPQENVVSLVDQLEEIEDITTSVHMVKEEAKSTPVTKAAVGCKRSPLLVGTLNQRKKRNSQMLSQLFLHFLFSFPLCRYRSFLIEGC